MLLIAHSMGGLAIRCAAAPSCNGGKDDVAAAIAAVTTFGTPHLGTHLKNGALGPVSDLLGKLLHGACKNVPVGNVVFSLVGLCAKLKDFGNSPASRAFRPGSREQRELPDFPAEVPVTSVAGKIDLKSRLFFKTFDIGDVGDAVVGTKSAHAQDAKHFGIGGAPTVDCGTIHVDLLPLSGRLDISCHHVSMTSDIRFLYYARFAAEAWTDLPDPTQIQYVSPVDNTGRLYPNLHVRPSSAGGTCRPSEYVPNTYTCKTTERNLSYDPCWAGVDDNGEEVARCVNEPWEGTYTTITDVTGFHTLGSTYTYFGEPWGLKLDNNELCLRLQNPSSEVDGKPITYTCDGDHEVRGDIDIDDGRWRVDTALWTSGTSTGLRGVPIAFYGQPSPF